VAVAGLLGETLERLTCVKLLNRQSVLPGVMTSTLAWKLEAAPPQLLAFFDVLRAAITNREQFNFIKLIALDSSVC
jgi:hypothetical protein